MNWKTETSKRRVQTRTNRPIIQEFALLVELIGALEQVPQSPCNIPTMQPSMCLPIETYLQHTILIRHLIFQVSIEEVPVIAINEFALLVDTKNNLIFLDASPVGLE